MRRTPSVDYFFGVSLWFFCGILASLSYVFVARIPHCFDDLTLSVNVFGRPARRFLRRDTVLRGHLLKQNHLAFIFSFLASSGLTSLCRVLAILCSLLAGKSHSLVLSPGHISFCFCFEGDIRVSLLPFRFEIFCASVICAPRLHPFVSFAGCIVFGIRLGTLEHDGISANQRTSQRLHVGVCFDLAQRKLVHARESFLHHSDDRVLVQTILDPTWRIVSKGVPGGVEQSGRRAKLCLRRRQVVPDRHICRD